MTKESIGLEKISPSALGDYEACPKLFYYRHWLGLKLPDSMDIHRNFGTAIHAAIDYIYAKYDRNFGGAWLGVKFEEIEEYFGHQWKIGLIADAEFVQIQKTKFGSQFRAKKALFEHMKQDGVKMLKAYWDNKDQLLSFHKIDIDETEISRRIEVVNPETKAKLPIPLSMRLDARTINKDVVELKTSGSRYDEEETRKKIQGLTYAFQTFTETGRVPKVHYIILLKNKKKDDTDRFQHIVLNFDMADMMAYWYRVQNILQQITNREFGRGSIGHNSYCECYKYEELLTTK